MYVRIVVLVSIILTLDVVLGGFFYNVPSPTKEEYEKRGLKCIPGRTVIKLEEKAPQKAESEEETRRSHMNAVASKDESCKICICSLEGKDEYCSRRPARNVNECIRLAILKKSMEKNVPYSHDRSLSFRIRRDYIWHYDEIPYAAKAACKRSTSYYTNNVNANDTDIDVPSDVDSLLDYSNKEICFYCVCSVGGTNAGCISRDPWYCEYYRIIRHPKAAKERYKKLFQQDRPAYFRHLSYRLRRTMDEGMSALMDVVGKDDEKCVPFVSQYSDCSEANVCSGCTRCTCTAEGEWDCNLVLECPGEEGDYEDNRHNIGTSLDILYDELKNKEKKQRVYVPPPPKPEDELIVTPRNPYEEDFASYLARQKRSVSSDDDANKNHTVKFYHTVDELNEDTLKNSDKSGTIQAKRVESNRLPKVSRRTDLVDNNKNKSSLHINYNQVEDYDHHIEENKIEPTEQSEKLKIVIKEKLKTLAGNYTQDVKDSELSKLIVKELKGGTEVIGNPKVPPVSNITFTPENDTLTAMAFIAGNLLNKLWDMERVASNDFTETDALKHEKINDLLELFKEPLNIRQEIFLKKALEKLSETLNRNKGVKNVSVCETIPADGASDENLNNNNKVTVTNKTLCDKKQSITKKEVNESNITLDVVDKLNNVISLMKKFEQVEKSINDLKDRAVVEPDTVEKTLTIDENSSMHLFGNLLEKITKLLIPNKSSKKIIKKIKDLNQFANKESNKNIIEEKLGIDVNSYNLTIKDKLILDYLNHIESNPSCLLRKNIERQSAKLHGKTGGRILYNLSELLKIKSLTDLMKSSKSDEHIETTTSMRTTTEMLTEKATTKTILRGNTSHKFNSTKEKLKSHLKAIIDVLLELQNDTNFEQNKFKIVDALPCIYNIMKADANINNKTLATPNNSPLNKIKILIDSMKLEFTTVLPSRRSNSFVEERPHSAKIWERVIKNINQFRKNTRRTSDETPKTYNELKEMIENVELTGNTYKNFALLSVIPPQKKLMLLKTLEADTKHQVTVLENIKKFTNNFNNLPADRVNELNEFVDNSETNINLSIKVMRNLNKQTDSKEKSSNLKRKEKLKMPELSNIFKIGQNVVKLTRDQIIIQLIENRIKIYLNSKETQEVDLSHDVNYNIGKRILSLIKSGNTSVAKELFKIFITNQRDERKEATTTKIEKLSVPFQNEMDSRVFRSSTSDVSPDQLFKRLLDAKNVI